MLPIRVIGIGLDGGVGLTGKLREIIKNATVLCGSSRHLEYFDLFVGTKIILDNLDKDIDRLKEIITDKDRVVILVSGDPLFYGLGRLLLSKFSEDKVDFYPHLSSIQLAFNSLKIPWHDARFVSVHGRSLVKLVSLLKDGIKKIGILTDRENNPSAIAKYFLSLDIPVFYSFHICENLGSDWENITSFEPQEIPTLAKLSEDNFSSLNVVILLRQDLKESNLDLDTLPLLGIPDTAFLSYPDRPSLMTKKEIRTVIVSELELQQNMVIWDIGSGTGSVSIEMARLSPTSQVYAIEKRAIGISLIKENIARFQVKNIEPISGKAEETINHLPSPDRIFIGGSGGNLMDILDISQNKILPQGIIVLALATLENCHQVLEWTKENNKSYSLLQLQISRSTPIAHLTRFSPLNPVTLIKIIF